MAIKNHKILMFAPWFPPHRNSEAHVTGRLVLAFLEHRLKLDVISSPRLDLAPTDKKLNVWQPLASITNIVPEVYPRSFQRIINRTAGIVTTGYFIRNISWAYLALRKAKELLKDNDYALIMSRCEPPVGHLPALVLVDQFKLPWIANWNDIEPSICTPPPYGNGKGLAAKANPFFMRYLQDVIRKASHHTFPSERMFKYMSKIFPELAGRCSVIPHIAKMPSCFENNHQDAKIFTICHAGSFDGRRNPMSFFRGLEIFLREYPDAPIKVRLLGNNYKGSVDFPIPDRLVGNIEVIPWCDYESCHDFLKRNDVLLVIEALMEESIFLPGKFVDYIQCRRPILAVTPKYSTIRDLISVAGGGICARCDSPHDIFVAIETLYKYWRNKTLNQIYNTNSLYNIFSPESIVDQYLKIFNNIDVKIDCN